MRFQSPVERAALLTETVLQNVMSRDKHDDDDDDDDSFPSKPAYQ